MAGTVYCSIVSAEEEIFSGDVASVVATGALGERGSTLVTPRCSPVSRRVLCA